MSPTLDPQARAAIDRRTIAREPASNTLSTEEYRDRFRASMTSQSVEAVETVSKFSIPGPAAAIPMRAYYPDGSASDDGGSASQVDGSTSHDDGAGSHSDGSTSLPVIVFFHGGGWVLGDLDCYASLCTRLANRANCLVVSVAYRRAPEHPFPAAPTDCYAATEWIAEHAADIGGDPDRLCVAGTSAGGNLASVVGLLCRDRNGPDLTHQALLYPAVSPTGLVDHESYRTYATGYSLTTASMRRFYEAYVRDPFDGRNAYAFPLEARDLTGLPTTTVLSAEFDPLRDEAFVYADRLEADGVAVTHRHYEGMIHDFLSMPDDIDAAEKGIDRIAADINDAVSGD